MRARRASACCACELSEQGGRSDEGRPASSARGVNGGRGQLGVAERSGGAWRRRREDAAAVKDAQVGRGGGLACAVLCSGVLRVRKERGRRRKEGEKKKRKGKKEKEREREKKERVAGGIRGGGRERVRCGFGQKRCVRRTRKRK